MKKIIITLFTSLCILSCNDDLLNISPKDRISDEAVWRDAGLIRAYHTNLYNSLLHGFRVNMQSKMTDEAYCSINWGPELLHTVPLLRII
ncbi:MAG: RagB/SusD family nutrient uptake outer membrane protein [Bacteroides sp.]|nr:RagB/SusD family nutrient uptake outer membrane protein [Bacteroides sp.]